MTIKIWLVFRLEDVCDDELPDKTEIKTDKSSPTVVFLEDIPRHPKNDVLPQKILDAMYVYNMSCDVTKRVFRVSDQVGHKQACTVTEDS